MIPSSPRRTWLFIAASSLLYFGPDLLLPAVWTHDRLYPALSYTYQCLLVLLGFAFAPAICRALVQQQLVAGPVHLALSQEWASLSVLPVVITVHELPFVLTAGLLPSRCQVFVSNALVERLSRIGLRFLCARALAHARWRQRLAALLPVLVFTLLPGDFTRASTWLAVAATLLLWLPLHWWFELDADRQVARMLGREAIAGLHEFLAATASPLDRYTPHPPLRWRLRAMGAEG